MSILMILLDSFTELLTILQEYTCKILYVVLTISRYKCGLRSLVDNFKNNVTRNVWSINDINKCH